MLLTSNKINNKSTFIIKYHGGSLGSGPFFIHWKEKFCIQQKYLSGMKVEIKTFSDEGILKRNFASKAA